MSDAAKPKRRKPFFHSVSVDVDIDADLLTDNGFHHEDECPASEVVDADADLRAFADWHDKAHGISLWAMCQHEPCKLLSDEFRSTP